MSDDPVDDGHQIRVVGLEGAVGRHVLDYIIEECVDFFFLEHREIYKKRIKRTAWEKLAKY